MISPLSPVHVACCCIIAGAVWVLVMRKLQRPVSPSGVDGRLVMLPIACLALAFVLLGAWEQIDQDRAARAASDWLSDSRTAAYSGPSPADIVEMSPERDLSGDYLVCWIGTRTVPLDSLADRPDGTRSLGTTCWISQADYVVILRPMYSYVSTMPVRWTSTRATGPLQSEVNTGTSTRECQCYAIHAWIVQRDSYQIVATSTFAQPHEWTESRGTVMCDNLHGLKVWLQSVGLQSD